jgi:hypothetical protein
MKLLLTSAGIKNPSINDAMLDLLGKPIAESDALCIRTASYGRGDSLYLAHHMLESGLADLLPSLSAVWVGLSAGSMVMTPRIGEDFKVWNPPDGGDRALGIVELLSLPARRSPGPAGEHHGRRGEMGSRLVESGVCN